MAAGIRDVVAAASVSVGAVSPARCFRAICVSLCPHPNVKGGRASILSDPHAVRLEAPRPPMLPVGGGEWDQLSSPCGTLPGPCPGGFILPR
jgi:hypothetical protein